MHIWTDNDGDICVEWVWSGGRLGLAQNTGEEDSWYLALKDDEGGEGSCGVLPFEMINWDQLEHWLSDD